MAALADLILITVKFHRHVEHQVELGYSRSAASDRERFARAWWLWQQ